MIAVVLAAFTFPAEAQQRLRACGSHAMFVKQLAERYGEGSIGIGMSANGKTVIELFVNTETGTWTILTSTPIGWSCMIASGENWQINKPKKNIRGIKA